MVSGREYREFARALQERSPNDQELIDALDAADSWYYVIEDVYTFYTEHPDMLMQAANSNKFANWWLRVKAIVEG